MIFFVCSILFQIIAFAIDIHVQTNFNTHVFFFVQQDFLFFIDFKSIENEAYLTAVLAVGARFYINTKWFCLWRMHAHETNFVNENTFECSVYNNI